MVVLGLLLVLASGAVALGIALSNTDAVSASAFGVTLDNVSIGGLFLTGVVIGGLLVLGLGLLLLGGARKRSRRVQTKKTMRATRSEKDQLAQENADLRAKLTESPAAVDPSTERVSGV
jgi:uncharacterized protein HemX